MKLPHVANTMSESESEVRRRLSDVTNPPKSSADW